MLNVVVIVICSIIFFECVFILIGNIFIIYVFWIYWKYLKWILYFFINLVVVDFFVGLIELIVIGIMIILWYFEEDGFMILI